MTITWLGHACFLLESEGFRILVDPYQNVPGLPDVAAEAEAVYCSHGHADHAYTDQVSLTEKKANPFFVTEVPLFHDDQGGALRGRTTARRFAAEGVSVVHLGDLGHQLTEEQAAAIGSCDVLLLPVGGTYTVDPAGAKQVAECLRPAVIVPMHYRLGKVGFDVLAELQEFLALYPSDRVRRYDTNVLTAAPGMDPQIAVLRLPQ